MTTLVYGSALAAGLLDRAAAWFVVDATGWIATRWWHLKRRLRQLPRVGPREVGMAFNWVAGAAFAAWWMWALATALSVVA